jgi:hypothetical protein
MLLCKKDLSALQRRSMRMFGGYMGLIVALTLIGRWLEDGHPPKAAVYLLAILPGIPVALMMILVGRYLARESDEFVRLIVMQALLWGFGITLVVDVVMGGLSAYMPAMGRLLPLLSVDLFWGAGVVALRVLLWRSR